MTENVTLSANQQRAINALLTEKDVRAAANKCNLSENTIYRYLREDAFRQALQQAHSVIYAEISNRLTIGVLDALNKLWAIVENAKDENVKRMAINDWLKHALKIREVDNLETRLRALEERIQAKDKMNEVWNELAKQIEQN